MATRTTSIAASRNGGLEEEIASTSSALQRSIRRVLESVPSSRAGTQAMADELGIDKVLASRVLKASRAGDAMSFAHRVPGPEPLRRFIRACAGRGPDTAALEAALGSVEPFEQLIKRRLGDRGALDAILAAWVPEVRRDFEVRNKQALFKSLSQLKGAKCSALMATAIVTPASDGTTCDVVWLSGIFDLQRIRPGVVVKLATRRLEASAAARRPVTLSGDPIHDARDVLLDEYCSQEAPDAIMLDRGGDATHYLLEADSYGPMSAFDVVFGEVDPRGLRRFDDEGARREPFLFADVTTPAEVLQFDLLISPEVVGSAAPELSIFDTTFDGSASPGDRSRDVDRLALSESIVALGDSAERIGSSDIPRYADLVGAALRARSIDPAALSVFRCRVDYPVYGSQVTMYFPKP